MTPAAREVTPDLSSADRITTRRLRVAQLVSEGYSERQIAAQLGVARSTVWADKQENAAGLQAEAELRDD